MLSEGTLLMDGRSKRLQPRSLHPPGFSLSSAGFTALGAADLSPPCRTGCVAVGRGVGTGPR